MNTRGGIPGEFEQFVILALVRLGDTAYGIPIRREIQARTGRTVILGAVYAALARMERKGWVTSTISAPEPRPGGRAKKYFRATPAGVEALRRSREMMARMSEGLDLEAAARTP